jgi:type IX secretion system PorP/SprF family membrane protein
MAARTFFFLVLSVWLPGRLVAQDPHYSQFFTAPATVNPALTGTGQGDWRFMTNQRRQWGNVNTVYNTFSMYGDMRLGRLREEGGGLWGVGLQVMRDKSMYGNFLGTYLSGSVSYQARLDDYRTLIVGMSATQSQRRLDAWSLSFGEQFRSGGFDLMLPNGEPSLSSLKPFFTLATGLLLVHDGDRARFDLGVGAFHVNRPRQSFLADEEQRMPMRISAHSSLELNLGGRFMLTTHALFQQQASQRYAVVGSALMFDLADSDYDLAVMGGAWYRTGDAFYPFFGMNFNALQVAVSYDVVFSRQTVAASRPSSFELSLIFRQPRRNPGVVRCPTR